MEMDSPARTGCLVFCTFRPEAAVGKAWIGSEGDSSRPGCVMKARCRGVSAAKVPVSPNSSYGAERGNGVASSCRTELDIHVIQLWWPVFLLKSDVF